jgi:hypothetical protein
MIKRAAAAGAVAWTAPVIVESLASPAAAVTGGRCDFYVFKMTRNGNSANCTAAIDTGTCSPATISGTSCTGYDRQTSTASPVNFTSTGACSGGASETVTFTINSTGRAFAGTAQSLATCSSTVTLNPASGLSVTLSQGTVPQNGVWYAYLAIS